MVAIVPRQNGARQDPQCRTSLRFFFFACPVSYTSLGYPGTAYRVTSISFRAVAVGLSQSMQ